MRKLTLVVIVVLLTGFAGAAIAQSGPPIERLKHVDDSRWDLAGKQLQAADDVLYRLTKQAYHREIFRVKERVKAPQEIFVVKETKETSIPQAAVPQPPRIERSERWVEVTPKEAPPQAKPYNWEYVERQGSVQ